MDDPWYESFRWEQEEIDYYRNVIGAGNHTKGVRIDVSTIHSVKGAEADHVVLLSDMTRSTYENLKNNPDSEHRAFYVGVTRAAHSLTIVEPSTKLFYTFYGKETE
jgi:superfamily I DNA/RNA helicase